MQAQTASGEVDVGRQTASVVTEFAFDDEGRMTARTLPLGQRESMEHDPNGNLVRKVTFNGEVLEYQYDDNDRMITKRVPGHADVLISYTPTGQRAAVVDERGLTRYHYDVRDRTTRVESPEGTIEYVWDAAGNRTRVSTPNGWTSYDYDAAGRMIGVEDSAAGVFAYAFDAAGNQLSLTNPNGVVETRTYDELNRLLTIDAAGPHGVVFSAAYTLDATGRRIAVAENGGRVVQWTSDALYRLTREQITDPVNSDENIIFTYDAVGNRLSREDLANGLVSSTYDANDRLTSAGGVARTYDAAGNTLSIGAAQSFTWSAEGRMVSAVTPSGLVGFAYDVDGIRVAKSAGGVARTYLNDHEVPYAEVLEERAGAAFEARYAQARDLVARDGAGEGVRLYHEDGITSVRAMSDAAGVATDSYAYEAFGVPRAEGASASRYRFAGEVRDEETGLQYHRARYYQAETGTFLGMDPVSGNHPFGYAGQAPTNAMDPSGAFFVEFAISVAIADVLLAQTGGAQPLEVPGSEDALLSSVSWGSVASIPNTFRGKIARAITMAKAWAKASRCSFTPASEAVAIRRNGRDTQYAVDTVEISAVLDRASVSWGQHPPAERGGDTPDAYAWPFGYFVAGETAPNGEPLKDLYVTTYGLFSMRPTAEMAKTLLHEAHHLAGWQHRAFDRNFEDFAPGGGFGDSLTLMLTRDAVLTDCLVPITAAQ